jgi:hypothetical protein
MIGTKLYKTYIENPDGGLGFWEYNEELYFKCACWCNENGTATIEDKGEYYEVVEIPGPSLEELKQSKIKKLKSERDTIQEEPIEYNGKLFDYNKESLQKLNEAMFCLEGTDNKQIWICADNTLTYLTYSDIGEIRRLGKERSNEVHIQYAKLKYIIEQLVTKEEVEAITFDTDTSYIQLEV